MKIWRASLVLNSDIDEDYRLWFDCYELKKDFKFVEKTNMYVHSEGLVVTRISKDMSIETHYGISIVQGFEKEPTADELEIIKKAMKELIEKELLFQKERYLLNLNKKLKAVEQFK